MSNRYKAPNGEEITGTLEQLKGEAVIKGITDDGKPDYEGTTRIWWDDQVTLTRDRKIIYLDESGNEWTFDELTKIEDEEEDEG